VADGRPPPLGCVCTLRLADILHNELCTRLSQCRVQIHTNSLYSTSHWTGAIWILQVRAKTFYAEKKGLNVADVDVPVIGGHAGITILPLFSQASPHAQLSDEETDQLTKRTQDGGTEVVTAKAGKVISTPPSHTLLLYDLFDNVLVASIL